MRPAIEHGCLKQTSSACKGFHRANCVSLLEIKNSADTELYLCARLGLLQWLQIQWSQIQWLQIQRLQIQCRCALGISDYSLRKATFLVGMHSGIVFAKDQLVHKPRSHFALHLHIGNLYPTPSRTFPNFQGVWFPQICLSDSFLLSSTHSAADSSSESSPENASENFVLLCSKRVASPKGEARVCASKGGFWPDVYFLLWDSYLFKSLRMSDGIGAAWRRQLRCRRWIGIVRRCSYAPATEAVLPSIYYARSVISRSGAALRRPGHHGTWFNWDMEPRGDFFWKIIHPKSSLEPVSPETQATSRLFQTTKSDPGSMEITKREGLLCFDLWFFQPK